MFRRRLMSGSAAFVLVVTLGPSSMVASSQEMALNGGAGQSTRIFAPGITQKDGSCELAEPITFTQFAKSGDVAWLAVAIDGNCNVAVEAEWTGRVADGPDHVTAPLLDVLQYESSDVAESSKRINIY